MPVDEAPRARSGRPQATSHRELELVALELFRRRGFDDVSVTEIAEAAGISRRTFFRYYSSKNDAVWGEFDHMLRDMEARLDQADGPLLTSIAEAVVAFNTLDPEVVPAHRVRMSLILHTPALQAHSALRYADWRAVVARHAARHLGEPVEGPGPQLVAHVSLAAALAAHEQWLADEGSDLSAQLREAFRRLRIDL